MAPDACGRGAARVTSRMEMSKYTTTAWGSEGAEEILKTHPPLFQAILTPSKMQLFVCLACPEHFASKSLLVTLAAGWAGRGWFP